MPPSPRPPRQEDDSYNAYGSPRMRGKFAGVRNGRQQPARPGPRGHNPTRSAVDRRDNQYATEAASQGLSRRVSGGSMKPQQTDYTRPSYRSRAV